MPIGIIVGAAVGGLALIVVVIVLTLYLRGRNHVVDRSKAGVFGSMMALVRHSSLSGSFAYLCTEYAQVVQRKQWPGIRRHWGWFGGFFGITCRVCARLGSL